VRLPALKASHQQNLWLALPYVLGWIVTSVLFYPGHMSGDTADPYLVAKRQLPVTDWHPPATAALWRALMWVWDSPASLLVVQAALFWGALAIIASTVRRRYGVNLTVALLAIAFLPFVFDYVGALIKDALSASVHLMAVALLVRELEATRRWAWLCGGAFGLLVLACLVRTSSVPVSLPLAVYAGWRVASRPERRSVTALLIAAPVVFLIAYVGGMRAVNEAMEARPANISRSIMLYDLAGMSERLDRNLLGPEVVPPAQESEFLSNCFDSHEWDSLVWGRCSWVAGNVISNGLWDSDFLPARWRQAIGDHPMTYAKHRWEQIVTYHLTAGKAPFYYEFRDARLPWAPNENIVMDAYARVITTTASWPWSRPILWLAGSVALLVASWRSRRRSPDDPLPALVGAMACGCLLFYGALTVALAAYEFRYSYTVILFVLVGASMLVASRRGPLQSADREAHTARAGATTRGQLGHPER
jgi:hypothetical protein